MKDITADLFNSLSSLNSFCLWEFYIRFTTFLESENFSDTQVSA
jgi:hypothetical protein